MSPTSPGVLVPEPEKLDEVSRLNDDSVACVEDQIHAYYAVLDKMVGVAALNHCGVKVLFHADGDISMSATHGVKFGQIEETYE